MTYTAHITCKNCKEAFDIKIPKGRTVHQWIESPTEELHRGSRLECPNCGCNPE